jgi:thioredoxin reductase
MAEQFDVVIIGGGPAGLSAGLALGRARRKVAILDRGERRNARAEQIHNFVTRDGTPPDEFRRIAREQLSQYTSVSHREVEALSVRRYDNNFEVDTDAGTLTARRILLCTGLIDEPLGLSGADQLWGHAIFQCPYCHGWENRDLRWGYLLHAPERVEFAMMLPTWSSNVTVFTHGRLPLPQSTLDRLAQYGIHVEARPIERLLVDATTSAPRLGGIELTDGTIVGCDALFAHPEQRQIGLVTELGVALDESGFVVADPMTRQTSVPGVYAAGDLTTRMQGAIFAAAAGTQAATVINHELALS